MAANFCSRILRSTPLSMTPTMTPSPVAPGPFKTRSGVNSAKSSSKMVAASDISHLTGGEAFAVGCQSSPRAPREDFHLAERDDYIGSSRGARRLLFVSGRRVEQLAKALDHARAVLHGLWSVT